MYLRPFLYLEGPVDNRRHSCKFLTTAICTGIMAYHILESGLQSLKIVYFHSEMPKEMTLLDF